jgi:hypothetical protein
VSLPEIEPGLIVTSLAVLLAVVAVVAMLRLRGGDATRDILHRLADAQADLSGRLSTLSDIQAARERELAERLQAQERALSRTLEERLADVTRRVGDSLQKQALETANTMGDLKERLAVIGKAQEKAQVFRTTHKRNDLKRGSSPNTRIAIEWYSSSSGSCFASATLDSSLNT